MKSLLTRAVLSAALLAASVAYAEAQMLKISMVISSADKVLGSPTIVVASGKTASVELGEKGSADAWNTKATLSPAMQADGSVLMPVTLKLTTEEVVDDKSQVVTREMTVQLKAELGKKLSITVPTNNPKTPFAMSMQVELVGEQPIAASRTSTAM